MTIAFADFRNAGCIIRSIDLSDLQEAGLFRDAELGKHVQGRLDDWTKWDWFRTKPFDFLLHADDDTAKKIWSIVNGRMTKPELVLPVVTISGTAPAVLLEQVVDAANAISHARDVLGAAAPNARDYRHDANRGQRHQDAVAQHVARLAKLDDMMAELLVIGQHVDTVPARPLDVGDPVTWGGHGYCGRIMALHGERGEVAELTNGMKAPRDELAYAPEGIRP